MVPHVVVLGGPNGAGKSTVAPYLLRDTLGVEAFVNADELARGLAAFAPGSAAIRAGRIMLDEIRNLTMKRLTFAFESTLAGLAVREQLLRCRASGYAVHLFYIWLPSPALALARVRARVAAGGHDVPERDIRRRWSRSILNLFDQYMPIATTWHVYDGSLPRLQPAVAHQDADRRVFVRDAEVWRLIQSQADAIRRGEPVP